MRKDTLILLICLLPCCWIACSEQLPPQEKDIITILETPSKVEILFGNENNSAEEKMDASIPEKSTDKEHPKEMLLQPEVTNEKKLVFETKPETKPESRPEEKVIPDDVVVLTPSLTSLSPSFINGGKATTIQLYGSGFMKESQAWVDGMKVATTFLSSSELSLAVPVLGGGKKDVYVQNYTKKSGTLTLDVSTSPPSIKIDSKITIDEEKQLAYKIDVHDADGDRVRVFVEGLPHGARWDESKKTIFFRPTFIQGGKSYPLKVTAFDGTTLVTKHSELEIKNSIQPPWPTVKSKTKKSGYTLYHLVQTTDTFLDSPGYAGRTFEARIVVPTNIPSGKKKLVRVGLHGLGGKPYTGGSSSYFRIYPHDPHTTYWYGYSDQLPNGSPTKGTVHNYTQRRIMLLLEWLLKNFPQADAEKVYVFGSSMGGAGAKFLGFRYARHFSYVSAYLGFSIMGNRDMNHSRLKKLQLLWGKRDANLKDKDGYTPWDHMDLTRMVRDDWEARNQYILTKHSKDDRTVIFGRLLWLSSVTNLHLYPALQKYKVGHYSIWDEGGHGTKDPVLGGDWWSSYWGRLTSSRSYVSRNKMFPAFTNCSADDDYGTGKGNGKVTYSSKTGYAGDPKKGGDTGWDGDIAGVINRYLRWDNSKSVDTIERAELPLRLATGSGTKAPKAGYPNKGDYISSSEMPITADVTLRRLQAFTVLVGETLKWSFGGKSGEITVAKDGSFTVPKLSFTKSWQTLVITRKDKVRP